MDEKYLLAATRYIELNPVRAGLVSIPEDYPWSSAKAHMKGSDDDLVKVKPLLRMVDDWDSFFPVMFPMRNTSCYNGINGQENL